MSALLDQRPQSGFMKQVREQEQAFAGVLCLTVQSLVKNKGGTPMKVHEKSLARSPKSLTNREESLR